MLRRTVVETLALALAAAFVAIALNVARPDRLPARLPADFYHLESGVRPVLLAGASRLFGAGAVFVDARTTEEYERFQIDGALSLPFEEWRERLDDVEPWIQGQKVVVYAEPGRVSLADDLAAVLKRQGHDSLYVYLGGIDEWRGAGLPLSEGPDPTLQAGDEAVDEESGWADEEDPETAIDPADGSEREAEPDAEPEADEDPDAAHEEDAP